MSRRPRPSSSKRRQRALARIKRAAIAALKAPRAPPKPKPIAPPKKSSTRPVVKTTLKVNPLSRVYNSLPYEVLAEIFVLCLPPSLQQRTSRREAPLLLSRVCRAWRRVALSLPTLWTAFTATYKPGQMTRYANLYHLWLQRSRRHPLSIELVPASYKLMPLLLEYVHRWKHLSVSLSQDLFDSLCSVASAPLLESLSISIKEDITTLDRLPLFFRPMPSLRKLIWKSARLPSSFLQIPLAQLTHLELSCSSLALRDHLNSLSHCTQLSHLVLHSQPWSHTPLPPTNVLLSHLTTFSLTICGNFGDFLDHFTAPLLRHLEIVHHGNHGHSVHSFQHFFLRSDCTLETFRLTDRHISEDTLIQYLSMPCLHSLRALNILASVTNNIIFLLSLSHPNLCHPCGGDALPRLERLELGRCTTTDGRLADMVLSRIQNKHNPFPPLSVFRVKFPKQSNPQSSHAHDVSTFKHLSESEALSVCWAWR